MDCYYTRKKNTSSSIRFVKCKELKANFHSSRPVLGRPAFAPFYTAVQQAQVAELIRGWVDTIQLCPMNYCLTQCFITRGNLIAYLLCDEMIGLPIVV